VHEDGFVGTIEWAAAGRPLPGQTQSGDRAIILDTGGDSVLFAVVDGLGHGPAAAEAADRAAQVLSDNRAEPLDVLTVMCHRALADTRGAALSLALFDSRDRVHWLGVGNVELRIVAAAPGKPAVRAAALLTAGIVGYRLPATLQTQTVPVRTGDLVLMATDGIVSDFVDEIDLSRPTVEITAAVLANHSKDTDDALVLAARRRGPSNPVPEAEEAAAERHQAAPPILPDEP